MARQPVSVNKLCGRDPASDRLLRHFSVQKTGFFNLSDKL